MANNDRKNGKAWKKKPKVAKKTGRTIGGYSPAKLAIRAVKRKKAVVVDFSAYRSIVAL